MCRLVTRAAFAASLIVKDLSMAVPPPSRQNAKDDATGFGI
jgi:hypothetical protein